MIKKELSIEEKAKAYDESKARTSRAWNDNRCTLGFMNEIFPELKESEDEKIRKELISFVRGMLACHDKPNAERGEKYESWIAWLEKQGEHANFRNKIQIGDKVTRNEDGVLVNLSQLKRIAKPTENKGKHGMGISEATKQKLEDNLNEALEKETPESCNEFLDEQGEPTEINPSEFDSQLNRLLGQFETLPKEELASSLSFYLNVVQNDGTYKDKEKKGEQKPTVEMKTPEESLGINSEEYNKIVDECIYGEQKPAWSEEDTQYINDTLALLSFGCSTHSVGEVKEWLQSLNNRVQPKQEWSEEDEINLKKAIWYVENPAPMVVKDSMLVEWLKSLKPHSTWKPSDEQMGVIEAVVNNRSFQRRHLDSLYEQLKKLREE